MSRTMNDETWAQGLPTVAVSDSACAVCRHTILNGVRCAQKCCADGCTQLRRENIALPRGFH